LKPKISVITAALNVFRTLPALYESLSTQENCDFEWIVADGGSTDGTLDLLQEFARRSEWLRFTSEPDFGIYDGINKAISRSMGQYYLVAGADDLLAPNALHQFSEIASDRAPDIVMARVMRSGKVIGGFHPRLAWAGPSRVFASSHSVSTLIRKSLHDRFGRYSPRFPLLADVHFLKKVLISNTAKFVDAPFIAGSFAEGGATSNNELQLLAENWQIQMLTEHNSLLQTVLFAGKILRRYQRLTSELRAHRNGK
jgi:glycosyltransferase involved in cell wall biosynthesis